MTRGTTLSALLAGARHDELIREAARVRLAAEVAGNPGAGGRRKAARATRAGGRVRVGRSEPETDGAKGSQPAAEGQDAESERRARSFGGPDLGYPKLEN